MWSIQTPKEYTATMRIWPFKGACSWNELNWWYCQQNHHDALATISSQQLQASSSNDSPMWQNSNNRLPKHKGDSMPQKWWPSKDMSFSKYQMSTTHLVNQMQAVQDGLTHRNCHLLLWPGFTIQVDKWMGQHDTVERIKAPANLSLGAWLFHLGFKWESTHKGLLGGETPPKTAMVLNH